MRAKLLQLCLTPCDSIYRSPHYSALKRKAVLSHAIPLRTVELSEIIIQVKWSVPEKTNTMWFRFHVVSRVVKLMETEAKHGHCLDWGKRNWELLLNGYRISVLHNEKVLEMDWTAILMYLTWLILHLKMVKMVAFILCVFYHSWTFKQKKKKWQRSGANKHVIKSWTWEWGQGTIMPGKGRKKQRLGKWPEWIPAVGLLSVIGNKCIKHMHK